ncbi:MAG: hypothetical protein ACE5FB_01315 [Candidatus Binatia bacterium]
MEQVSHLRTKITDGTGSLSVVRVRLDVPAVWRAVDGRGEM